MSATFMCRFGLDDRVCIDGDDTIVAVVVEVRFGQHGAGVMISWFADGSLNEALVSDRRLTAAPKHLVRSRVVGEENC